HPCAAPYNKSRSVPAKRLWKHSGYFLKKRLITTNRCNGFNGAAHPLCGNKPWGGLFVFCAGYHEHQPVFVEIDDIFDFSDTP
ncbi:MAG: hypothetical protein WA039_06900, partial [Gemmiger qucibialis]